MVTTFTWNFKCEYNLWLLRSIWCGRAFTVLQHWRAVTSKNIWFCWNQTFASVGTLKFTVSCQYFYLYINITLATLLTSRCHKDRLWCFRCYFILNSSFEMSTGAWETRLVTTFNSLNWLNYYGLGWGEIIVVQTVPLMGFSTFLCFWGFLKSPFICAQHVLPQCRLCHTAAIIQLVLEKLAHSLLL